MEPPNTIHETVGTHPLCDTRAVAALSHPVAMTTVPSVVRTEFTLVAPGLGPTVEIRLGRAGDRWVAVAQIGDEPEVSLGGTARQALEAALAPLGPRIARALLADTALLAPSVEIVQQEQAAG